MQTISNSYHFGAYFIHQDEEGRKRNEDSEQLEESYIYARMKHQSCKHYKSRAIRTPFASYGRRKLLN